MESHPSSMLPPCGRPSSAPLLLTPPQPRAMARGPPRPTCSINHVKQFRRSSIWLSHPQNVNLPFADLAPAARSPPFVLRVARIAADAVFDAACRFAGVRQYRREARVKTL